MIMLKKSMISVARTIIEFSHDCTKSPKPCTKIISHHTITSWV